MVSIQTGPNEIAQWHGLVLEAQSASGLYLAEPLEQYLVMTLYAYTTNTSLSTVVITLDFLSALQDTSSVCLQKLRDVGDQCLILSGLFPEQAKRRNVSPAYFVNIGKEAYHSLSAAPTQWQVDQHLFYQLFESFSDLTKLLAVLRIRAD